MPSKPVSSPRIKQESGDHESLTAFAIEYRLDDKNNMKAEVEAEFDDGSEYSAEEENNSDDDPDASLNEEDEDAEGRMSDDHDSEDPQQDDRYDFVDNCKETEPVHPLYYLGNYGPSLCSGLNRKVRQSTRAEPRDCAMLMHFRLRAFIELSALLL